jgi:hypothetical protein
MSGDGILFPAAELRQPSFLWFVRLSTPFHIYGHVFAASGWGRRSARGGLPGRLHRAGRGPAAAQGAAPHCSRIRGRIFETAYLAINTSPPFGENSVPLGHRALAAIGKWNSSPTSGNVIAGGESGPGARPMNPHWVRNIRDQCERASVGFFLKQWGGFSKKKAGRMLDGRTWDDMPEALVVL